MSDATLWNLRKSSYWKDVQEFEDGSELMVSPDREAAMLKRGEKIFSWHMDLKPGESIEDFKVRRQNKKEEFELWLAEVKKS